MRLTLLSQMLGTFLIQLIGKRKEAIKLLKPKRILLRVTNLGSLKMKSKIKLPGATPSNSIEHRTRNPLSLKKDFKPVCVIQVLRNLP